MALTFSFGSSSELKAPEEGSRGEQKEADRTDDQREPKEASCRKAKKQQHPTAPTRKNADAGPVSYVLFDGFIYPRPRPTSLEGTSLPKPYLLSSSIAVRTADRYPNNRSVRITLRYPDNPLLSEIYAVHCPNYIPFRISLNPEHILPFSNHKIKVRVRSKPRPPNTYAQQNVRTPSTDTRKGNLSPTPFSITTRLPQSEKVIILIAATSTTHWPSRELHWLNELLTRCLTLARVGTARRLAERVSAPHANTRTENKC